MAFDIDASNPNGAAFLEAVEMIKDGLAKLDAEYARCQFAIGVGASEVERVYGCAANQGQTMNDEWAQVLTAWDDAKTFSGTNPGLQKLFQLIGHSTLAP